MPPRRTLQDRLDEIADLEAAPATADVAKKLRDTLERGKNVLAARAAKAAASRGMVEMIPDLLFAFDRFMQNPLRTDKACLAKIDLISALNALRHDDEDVFLTGARHVQLEPVYGGRADTATNVRIESVFGLVRIGYVEVLFVLADLLTDREVDVRRAAVKALAHLGGDDPELLLRMRVRAGDGESDVVVDCFSALTAMAPKRSLPFVAPYMEDDSPPIAEGAAIAIGSSASPEAFDVLRRQWDQSLDAEHKKMLLLPLALTRTDEAFEFLLQVVEDEHQDKAVAAVSALTVYGENASQVERIRAAVEEREQPQVTEAFGREFGV